MRKLKTVWIHVDIVITKVEDMRYHVGNWHIFLLHTQSGNYYGMAKHKKEDQIMVSQVFSRRQEPALQAINRMVMHQSEWKTLIKEFGEQDND